LPGDDRFGVTMHTTNEATIKYFLEELGVRWYSTGEDGISQIPDGAKALVLLNLTVDPGNWTDERAGSINEISDFFREAWGFHSTTEIQEMVAQNPGGAWLIITEPNRRSAFMTASRAAAVYHYYYMTIKAADSTAKVLSPAVLNWDWTCLASSGCRYESGGAWFANFVSAYQALNDGALPPADALAIQVYPIDWFNVPNQASGAGALQPIDPDNFPQSTTHSALAAREVRLFRTYLDANGYANTPVWLTETAIHWGYDGHNVVFDEELGQNVVVPVGAYHHEFMADYLIDIVDWLEANSADQLVDRWFYYVSYRELGVAYTDGFGGLRFFEAPGIGASLSCVGAAYKALSLNTPRKTCAANGDTINE